MERIEIDINDNRRFADVALLVDKEKFLQDIHNLRAILGFPLYEGQYKEWVKQSERNELQNDTFQELVKWVIKQPECEFVDFPNKKHIDTLTALQHAYHKVIKGKLTITKVIDYLASFLCSKYKRNRNFKSVISKALITNKVTDDDYETVMLRLFPHTLASNEDYEPDGKVFFEQPNYFGFALYFLPNTSKTELIKILDRDLPEMQRLYNDLILKQRPMNVVGLDIMPSIQWYRDWYWLNKQYGYQRISKMEMDKSADKRIATHVSWDRVRKGIKAYIKLLSLET